MCCHYFSDSRCSNLTIVETKVQFDVGQIKASLVNPLYKRCLLTVTLTNSEDPDEMLHNVPGMIVNTKAINNSYKGYPMFIVSNSKE